MANNSKQKMSELLTKLGDRDTFTMAAKELDSMARNIDPTSGGNLQSFVSVVLSADAGDKPAVRKHCIHLLAPLSEALFTEREANAQIGAGLCLAAAIDAAEDPDPGRLGTTLLPRLEKLVKCNAFKAKSAGVVVIGSVIGAGGVSGGGLRGLLDCLVSFLSSEDWAARKAAAEALGRLATVERKIFEGKRYDKVKAVREVMNQMIEVWTQVPDLSEEVSPPRSNASSKGSGVASTPAKPRTRLVDRSTPPGSSVATARRRTNNVRSSDQKKTSSVPSHTKSNVRRRLELKAGGGASILSGEPLEEEYHTHNENTTEEGQMQKLGGGASSHVLSENKSSSNNCRGSEDMSLIRSQLVQIEQQQSNLMDLLQRFVGSSQHGMHSLETRVQGLELALDEISYDLAVSNGRMSSNRNNCCLIPPGRFITSKFWKKSVSAPRLATYRNRNAQTMGLQGSRQRFNGPAGFIVNPLAEIRPDNVSAGMPHN
ncbi:ARM repeat superfamily protein [Raphanus sativus]|nr:ARM repeat superfamily protein [Raphanus sativus]